MSDTVEVIYFTEMVKFHFNKKRLRKPNNNKKEIQLKLNFNRNFFSILIVAAMRVSGEYIIQSSSKLKQSF